MSNLVTIEGISGVGKSYYFKKLKEVRPEYIYNGEINDEKHTGINEKIFDILTSKNSRFFDNGNAKLETLLIAAKQANDEKYFKELKEKDIVVSDRGFDTICILEGIIMGLNEKREIKECISELYKLLPFFNKVPDKTILLIDDFEESIKRAEKRDGKPYTLKELTILKESLRFFNYYAMQNKERFHIINIANKKDNEIIDEITNVIDSLRRNNYEDNFSYRKLG